MNEKQIQILEKASELFMRYGVRRTTMGEVAKAAKISRPTLYGFFTSKEDLLGGVVELFNHLTIGSINSELDSQSSLSGKLDIVFDHAIVRAFDLMQTWPDAGDIVAEDNQQAVEAYQAGLNMFEEVVRRILDPYVNSIERGGQTVSQYAEFVVATASKLKKNPKSRDQLLSLLNSLKVSILSVAGEL